MQKKTLHLSHKQIEQIAKGENPQSTLMEVYLAGKLLEYKARMQVENDRANKYYGYCYKMWATMEKADTKIRDRRKHELNADAKAKEKRIEKEIERLQEKLHRTPSFDKVSIYPPFASYMENHELGK